VLGAEVAIVLGFAGLLDSLYFTLVYYGKMKPSTHLVAEFCRMDAGTCQTVFQAAEAKVFGIPNSVLGIAYYAIIVSAGVFRLATGEWPALPALLAISIAVVVFSLYLAWTLIFRMRVSCPLCFFAHAVNIAIASVFIAAA